MNASMAHRLQRYQAALVALSAPGLLRDVTRLRPRLAVAPLEKSLTLRALAELARVRAKAPRCK